MCHVVRIWTNPPLGLSIGFHFSSSSQSNILSSPQFSPRKETTFSSQFSSTSQIPRIPGLMLLTNGLWELIDPLSGLSSLFPVFWCFEEQLAISSCECFPVVVFVQITLFEQSWPYPFVHFFCWFVDLFCFLVLLLLFISPCLNSPGLAEQLEGEAEEGCEAREPDTKTNLGISDFYKWRIAWKIRYKTTRPDWKNIFFYNKNSLIVADQWQMLNG